MNECEKIQELVSCLIDGELSENEKAEVEKHIAACPTCAAVYKDFAALSGAMDNAIAEVPAALHDSIMSGVKAAAVPVRKKKNPVIILRPYMTAAACLVVVVGAVLAFRSSGFDAASSALTTGTADCASVPASYAANAEPEEAPAEPVEAPMECEDYSTGIPSDDYAYGLPTVESEMESNVTAEETDSGSRIFIPGSPIDEAVLILTMSDGSEERRELSDMDALIEALTPMDFSEPFGSEFISSALLELQAAGQSFVLELSFAGETLIVRQNGECYVASATPQELFEIN